MPVNLFADLDVAVQGLRRQRVQLFQRPVHRRIAGEDLPAPAAWCPPSCPSGLAARVRVTRRRGSAPPGSMPIPSG